MRPTLSKLAAFWQRRSLDARLEAETRTQLEMLAAEYERTRRVTRRGAPSGELSR